MVVAEEEQPVLPCPLQIVESFSEYYVVEWRVPVDMKVAESKQGVIVPWARLDSGTLALTVGPLNSTLPRVFECVVLAFQRKNLIRIDNAPKGIVNISIPSKFCMQCLT